MTSTAPGGLRAADDEVLADAPVLGRLHLASGEPCACKLEALLSRFRLSLLRSLLWARRFC